MERLEKLDSRYLQCRVLGPGGIVCLLDHGSKAQGSFLFFLHLFSCALRSTPFHHPVCFRLSNSLLGDRLSSVQSNHGYRLDPAFLYRVRYTR